MLTLNIPVMPVLETERLILREYRLEDASVLFNLRRNPDVMQYIERPRPEKVSDSEAVITTRLAEFKQQKNIVWVIALKTHPDQMIGDVGYWRFDLSNHRAELGYILDPAYWRKGILTEALTAVLNFGFETLNLHSICANINPQNEASRRLLLKTGFQKEALFREDYYFEGKFIDSEIYGLLNPAHI